MKCRSDSGPVWRMLLYLDFSCDDVGVALGLDARQLQLLAQDCGQLFERDSTSSRWPPPGSLPAGPWPFLGSPPLADRLALFAVALPDAAGAVVAEAEVRHVELRHRNADQIAALAADHLAVRDVLAQILADPAADDLAEAALIAFDFHDHRCYGQAVALDYEVCNQSGTA